MIAGSTPEIRDACWLIWLVTPDEPKICPSTLPPWLLAALACFNEWGYEQTKKNVFGLAASALDAPTIEMTNGGGAASDIYHRGFSTVFGLLASIGELTCLSTALFLLPAWLFPRKPVPEVDVSAAAGS